MKHPLLCAGAMALAIAGLTGCADTAQVSKGMLSLTPESMKMRQIQTKRFDTNDEPKVLSASASVLQDLGFQLDESNPELGILVGSKVRDATDAGQVTLAIFVAALGGGNMPVDQQQTIRVSLVTAPMVRPKESGAAAAPRKKITPAMVQAACARINASVRKDLDAELAGLLVPKDATQVRDKMTDQFAREVNTELTQQMKNQDFGATRVRVTFQRVVLNNRGMVSRMEPLEAPELYKTFYEKLSKSVFLEANDI